MVKHKITGRARVRGSPSKRTKKPVATKTAASTGRSGRHTKRFPLAVTGLTVLQDTVVVQLKSRNVKPRAADRKVIELDPPELSPPGSPKYNCPHCSRTFDDRSNYLRHFM